MSPRFSAAAQDTTKQVGSLEGAEAFERDLRRLFDEASETKRLAINTSPARASLDP